ncbi:MAG: hypothetical protein U0798_04635 [Gemmataceae bacterium]
MAMMPHERSLVERLKDKPFALIGVNGDDNYEGKAFQNNLEKHKVVWRSFRNDGGPDFPPISDMWNIGGWPTLFLIDHKGTIRHIWEGGPGNDVMDYEIDCLIAEAEGKPKPEKKKKEPKDEKN